MKYLYKLIQSICLLGGCIGLCWALNQVGETAAIAFGAVIGVLFVITDWIVGDDK